MRGSAPYLCCIALAIAPTGADGRERWRATVALTTDYVVRGVSQTAGGAALQAGLTYQSARGWYAGAWGSNVDKGPTHLEVDLFAGYTQPLARDWSIDVQFVRYEFPDGDMLLDYDYSELAVALAYRDWLRLSLAASNDTTMFTYRGLSTDRTALAWDVGVQRPLGSRLSVVAGLGYYDLRHLFDTGYVYGSLGLYTDIGPLRIDLSHYRTDSEGRELFGSELAGGRTVLSVVSSFR